MYDDYEPQHDYQTVQIPKTVNTENYTAAQRRAKLYERIKEHGFGGIASYRDLGAEFDVSPSMIKKDMDELRPYILKNDFQSESFRSKIIENLNWALDKAREEEDHKEASKIANRLNNYLQSIGVEQEEPEKVQVEEEVTHSFREAYKKHHKNDEEE